MQVTRVELKAGDQVLSVQAEAEVLIIVGNREDDTKFRTMGKWVPPESVRGKGRGGNKHGAGRGTHGTQEVTVRPASQLISAGI